MPVQWCFNRERCHRPVLRGLRRALLALQRITRQALEVSVETTNSGCWLSVVRGYDNWMIYRLLQWRLRWVFNAARHEEGDLVRELLMAR